MRRRNAQVILRQVSRQFGGVAVGHVREELRLAEERREEFATVCALIKVGGKFSSLRDTPRPLDERERSRLRRTIHSTPNSADRSASDGEPTEMK